MEKVYFMTLKPDDYHGAPEVHEFTNESFPLPLDKDDVFNYWMEAGYNSFNMGDFESEEEAFDLYGDAPCYYVTYIISLNESISIEKISEFITDEISYAASDLLMTESVLDVDGACDVIKEISGVVDVFPIEFDT